MKIKSLLCIFLFVLLSNSSFGQKKITWTNVLDIYAKEFRLAEVNPQSALKEDGMSLEDIENTKVKIVGYFLDLDPDGKWFMISKNPFASCFFCGKSGPETILELFGYKNTNKKFKSDDIVEVTGFFNPVYDLEGKVSFGLDKATLKLVKK